MTKLYLLPLALALIIVSCKSTSKAFQKGDYTDAIELGVKKLQKDPHDLQTKDMVLKSYSYEITEHEDRVRVLSNSSSDLKYDQIYQEYAHMQNLYAFIHQYPAVASMIPTKDYSEMLQSYGDKAAQVHQDKGTVWMNDRTKASYRLAFKEFNEALRYRPDDINLKRDRDEAYDLAITKVIIAPMQPYSGYQYSSAYQLQNFQNDIIRILANNMHSDFIRFYSEWEAKNKNIEPDQILELNFTRIIIGQPFDEKNTREITKQVVTKEIVYKPDSVIKQYQTVTAKIVNTKRTLLSQGDLYITVRDTKGRIIWNDRFTGENKWTTEFATFSGDERALEESDKTLCKKNDYTPPGEPKIMGDLMGQIQNDLSSRLRSYYTKTL